MKYTRWQLFWYAAAGVALALVGYQVLWFVLVLAVAPAPPAAAAHADLLAVYGGLPERYEAGWATERAGQFKYLVFSDASPAFVEQMQRQHGGPLHALLLLEPNARTTAQNARYVAKLAVEHGCRNILVVTSWWHLPRAVLLTRIALLNQGIRVWGLASEARPPWPWMYGQIWRELLRFWGSMLTFESDTRTSSHFLADSHAN